MRHWIAVWLGALSSALACHCLAPAQTASLADLNTQYLQSVQQASPDPTSLPTDVTLTTISKTAGQVQMTIFTNYTGYNRLYNENTNPALWHPDMFSTAGHELYDRVRQMSADQVTLQTKQLLGLPPDSNYDRVVEYLTGASKLFRPAYDSNIEDSHPSNIFNPADPKADWFLHHWNAWNSQTGSFTYSNLKSYPPAYDYSSYTDSSGVVHSSSPYPWTRLGYTYNWANVNSSDPNAIVGLTEFVTPHHWSTPTPGDNDDDPIAVQAMVSIGSYMYYDRNTGNFDVTGACDTIWAGTLCTPVNPNAGESSWIHVHAGATVAQGITVSSQGFLIVNEGTILGPGKNLDNTYRDNAVEFVHGGALVNSGLIDGAGTGVSIGGAAGENIAVDNSGVIRGSQYAIQAKAGTACDVAVANAGLLFGSLQLGDGNNAIENSGTIVGNIVTGAGNDAIALHGGTVTGNIDAGSGINVLEVKPGIGNTVTLNGNISNVQAFDVQNGTACFNGQVNTSVTVDSGATLTGSGTYVGNLVNQGAVALGNSASAIHVNGNYTQGAGGVLQVQVGEPYPDAFNPGRFTTASQINVTSSGTASSGIATIADGAQIVVGQSPGSQGVIRTADRFTVITAQGGITANPANQQVSCDSDFLQFSGATARPAGSAYLYQLVAQRTATFASLAQGANRQSLAAALDADSAVAYGDYAGMIDNLLFMRAAQFNQALCPLSPAPYQDVSLVTLRTAQFMAESTADYLRSRRNGQYPTMAIVADMPQGPGPQYTDVSFTQSPATSPAEMIELANGKSSSVYNRFGFFDPFGISYGDKSIGDHVGFQANSVGARFGFDKQASENLIFGVEGGYANTSVSFADAVGGGQINTYCAGPYMTYYSDAGYCDAVISGGFHANDFQRNATTGGSTAVGQANYTAGDFALYTDVGAYWPLDGYTLSPCVSLQYIYYHGGSFAETGNGADSLTVTSQDVHSLRSKFGARVSRPLTFGRWKIVPEFFLGWAHEFLADEVLDARFTAGATTFATDPGGLFRDAASFDGAISIARGPRCTLFLRYTGELSNGGQFNAANAGFSLGF